MIYFRGALLLDQDFQILNLIYFLGDLLQDQEMGALIYVHHLGRREGGRESGAPPSCSRPLVILFGAGTDGGGGVGPGKRLLILFLIVFESLENHI